MLFWYILRGNVDCFAKGEVWLGKAYDRVLRGLIPVLATGLTGVASPESAKDSVITKSCIPAHRERADKGLAESCIRSGLLSYSIRQQRVSSLTIVERGEIISPLLLATAFGE